MLSVFTSLSFPVDRIFVADFLHSKILMGQSTGSTYFNSINTELPLRGLSNPTTVDYDPGSNMVYWADQGLQSISRAKLDGTAQEIILQNLGCKCCAVHVIKTSYMLYLSEMSSFYLNIALAFVITVRNYI